MADIEKTLRTRLEFIKEHKLNGIFFKKLSQEANFKLLELIRLNELRLASSFD